MRKLCMILLMVLAACTNDPVISRRYQCRFVFYQETHPTSIIFAALRSPGMYVAVTTEGNGRTTVRHIYAQSNDGKSPREDNALTTDIEKYAVYYLGARDDIGLIIGCTNFNGPVAWDRSCPNCTALQTLHWTGTRQQVMCNNCQRTYELETGAILSGAKGDALLRYGLRYDGNVLSVGN